jgi:hypothetical protein
MVLYRYSVSFFRPAGRKNDTEGIKNGRQAKVLCMFFSSGGVKKNIQREKSVGCSTPACEQQYSREATPRHHLYG